MENTADDAGNADTTVELEEADDLIDVHYAIVNDEEANLEELCGQVSNLDARFLDDLDPQHLNMTPLALASALNKPHLCKVLLKNGASVDATFASLKTTALMTSSFHGHPDVVRVLLAAGSDARRTDVQHSTALGYCFGGSRQQQVVEQLIEARVDVNLSNVLGMNAFLLVSGYGNPELLNMVLEAGARVDGVVNNYGHTPFHLAVLGKLSQVNVITQKGVYNSAHYGLNRRNVKQMFVEWARNNQDVLENVEVGEKFEKVGQLMEELGSHFLSSRFSSAGLLSDEEQLKQKVEAAADLRNRQLSEAGTSKKNSILDSILSCGGKRGKQGRGKASKTEAPLERPEHEPQSLPEEQDLQVEMMCKDFLQAMSRMAQVGCTLDGVEHTFALTPLDIAILNGDMESSALLLSRGANPDHLMATLALSDLYHTITALRPDKKHIKDLLDNDKHLNVNNSFTTANIPTRLSESEIEDMIGDSGLTPLAVAAKCRDNSTADVIKMLLKHGADMNVVGEGGRTPLGEACRWGNVKMVEFLLSQGADIEQPNPAFKQATPVAIATISRQPATVQLLISKGGKIDKEMSDHRTALISATDSEDMAMVDKLLQADPVLNCHNHNSLDHQVIKLFQSPNKDIRVILQEISKRAAEIKAEEEEEEDEMQRSEVFPDLRMSKIKFPVYETIQSEKVELETKENVPKIKKKKSKKGKLVSTNEDEGSGNIDDGLERGKDVVKEVVEELIVPQTRRTLEQQEFPIYSEVNKAKKSRRSRADGNTAVEALETNAEDVSAVMSAGVVPLNGDNNANEFVTVSSPQPAFQGASVDSGQPVSLERNRHEDRLNDIEGDGEMMVKQANEEAKQDIQLLEEAFKKDLLETAESPSNEPTKVKKKKIKKKISETVVEETQQEDKVGAEVVPLENVLVASKKKTKKKVKAVHNGQENKENGEEVMKEEVVEIVETVVEGKDGEQTNSKIVKKKKSQKKKIELENEEVTV